jgi:hypothetical protein
MAASLTRRGIVSLMVAMLLATAGPAARGQEAVKPEHKKWIGKWNEPYALVGTRRIIEIQEKDGKLVGKFSDPAVPNGVFNVRMWFSLKDVVVVDDDTLTWKEGSLTVTATFIPGEDGSPATMETSTDPKGTIGAWFGQKKPLIAKLKKE